MIKIKLSEWIEKYREKEPFKKLSNNVCLFCNKESAERYHERNMLPKLICIDELSELTEEQVESFKKFRFRQHRIPGITIVEGVPK